MDDLASTWAGINTVCMVEKDKWCQRFLRYRFPGIPIIGDVHDVTKEKIRQAIADSQKRQGKQRNSREVAIPPSAGQGQHAAFGSRGKTITHSASRRSGTRRSPDGFGASTATDSGGPFIDVIGAGVPCQPVSIAGRRRGKADDRWLWDETLRVVSEFQPTWVIAENPAGILSMAESVGEPIVEGKTISRTAEADLYKGIYTLQESLLLRDILEDFTRAGYGYDIYCVPACGVGAFHKRYRVFIVAHYSGNGGETRFSGPARREGTRESINNSRQEVVSDALGVGSKGWHRYCPKPRGESAEIQNQRLSSLTDWAGGGWEMPEPLCPKGRSALRDVCRVDDGSAEGLDFDTARYDRVNRLKALGNGCVPQQVFPFYQAIVKVESQEVQA